jgi:hypothetical protein
VGAEESHGMSWHGARSSESIGIDLGIEDVDQVNNLCLCLGL